METEKIASRFTFEDGFRWFVRILKFLVVFSFAVHAAAYNTDISHSDFPIHAKIAEDIARTGHLMVPHFLYHILLIALTAVLPISMTDAGYWIVLLTYGICGIIIYQQVAKRIESRGGLKFVIALSLMLIAPFNLLTYAKHNLYLGYLSPIVYHNPTIAVLRPLALAHLLLLVLLATGKRTDRKLWIISGMLLVLGGLAKPSYLLCALPVMGIWMLIERDKARRNMLLLSQLIPGALLLLWQYYFIYYVGSPDYPHTQVIFLPFGAMRLHSMALLPKLIASILFPLSVVLLFSESRKDVGLRISWAMFAVGALYSYLLAESGSSMWNLNFLWCAEITLWLLMIQSALTLLSYPKQCWRSVICWCLFALQTICGVVWFFEESLMPGKYW